ncbi:ImmA/IrrE family metallo-endopeptidase [Streptococcus gallolyticus]|uniref:ImmA/IrrE family metallo-endopeptidase n=1 Tax=Streptococcus gallolyticus TaxID=315405 RepID=UPI002DDCCDAA|nr:ImmA/IrrE family metallo-endopeptidase [Streptococcus gallolyticus]
MILNCASIRPSYGTERGSTTPRFVRFTLIVNLSEREKKKVIYHELGHLEHDASQYDRRRELFEIQANRKMIHSILEEELSCCDKEEIESFNYVQFMKKYDLVSMVDEELIKEEFLKLIS